MIFNTTNIFVDHIDFIHDVSYDYYGDRLATCSSDLFVKVSNIKYN